MKIIGYIGKGEPEKTVKAEKVADNNSATTAVKVAPDKKKSVTKK